MSSFLKEKQSASVEESTSSTKTSKSDVKHPRVDRRAFLKSSLMTLGGLSVFSAGLTACSTFDEFIFEDQSFLKDEVVIVGGGITGLFLAYKLRLAKTEFHLFEGSATFGGRIRSHEGTDFGASLFEQTDTNLKSLLKEFNLKEIPISKTQFYVEGGAEKVITALKDRLSGLMPYRNIRLRWRLVEISKKKNRFELIFETPSGRRTIDAKKIALTLPPTQWSSVTGLLELEEMAWAQEWLATLKPESIVKVNYPISAGSQSLSHLSRKTKNEWAQGQENLTLLIKNLKNNILGLEFEYKTSPPYRASTGRVQPAATPTIESLSDFMSQKAKLNIAAKKISTDNFFNWAQVELIQGAYFKNAQPWPSEVRRDDPFFQICGDFSASSKAHTVEGALLEAQRASSILI